MTAVATALAIAGFAPLAISQIATAASTITLSGVVLDNCNIGVVASTGASNLDLTGTTAQHINVGTVSQSCNKRAGYTIVVTSTNCASPTPAGAKLVGTGTNTDKVSYSVESQNPTTGGSQAVVTGLLASACTGQNARVVTNSKITSEISTIYVNYTGSPSLSADTYQDTLTFTMTVN
jgi:hypothetical protein